MKLWFITHSCYLIDTGYCYLLFDYYQDGRGGVSPLRYMDRTDDPLIVFSTHGHEDHYSDAVFDLVTEGREVAYVFHASMRSIVPPERAREVLFLETGEGSPVMGMVEVRAYGSTDEGGSFYVRESNLLERTPLHLFHAGDLNCWHWNEEANDHYVRLYEEAYEQELDRFRHHPVKLDLLMFPTDTRLGKDYLKGLRLFLEVTPARYVAPMHLNGKIVDRSELETLCQSFGATLLFPERDGEQHEVN